MENLVPLVRRQAYNAYHDHPELLEPIFALFQTTDDGEHVMRDVTTQPVSGSRRFIPGVKDVKPILNGVHHATNSARTAASSPTILKRYLQVSSALISLSRVVRSLAPLSNL
jgi:hypothetical protein